MSKRNRIKRQRRGEEVMYLTPPPAPIEPVVVSPMMNQILNGPAPMPGMQYCGVTPLLNAALDAAISRTAVAVRTNGDEDLDTQAVLLLMIRSAGGHWRDLAVSTDAPYFKRVKTSEVPPDILHGLLFGDHECWYCGKMAEPDMALPDFCWHRHCLLIAYARDAVLFGEQAEINWGSDVLNGYHYPIPQPPGLIH